jgi:MFS family permease
MARPYQVPEYDAGVSRPPWLSRTVVGIILATFLSDLGHEAVTAVLPLYLASVGLGPLALGVMEGVADLGYSLSKLAGGVVGHKVARKQPWIAGGYVLTMIGTGAIALVKTIGAVASLRAIAWLGRGFRSPMRDFMLADEVGSTHYGRAYGVERTADMLGALLGPLAAAGLVWVGASVREVILWSIVPSALAAASILFLARDRAAPVDAGPSPAAGKQIDLADRKKLPRAFWWLVGGVLLFGLGDFSRTFLILIAAGALGEVSTSPAAVLSTAVLIYAGHNLVSAIAAYPAGRLGDAWSRPKVLVIGYALGVATNVLLATGATSLAILLPAIALSGIYIAIEETLEKAVVAGMLPRELRSLGLGILATANSIGDLGSSLFVGAMLHTGHPTLAFAGPAVVGALGVLWMLVLMRRQILR